LRGTFRSRHSIQHREDGLSVYGVLLLLIIAVVVVNLFWITGYRVPQTGMFPTIGKGGVFLAKKNPYSAANEVQHGDVVVFTQTIGGDERRLVWRVIGLPGETVSMDGTSVWVNGELLPHKVIKDSADDVIIEETNSGASYQIAYDRHSIHPALPLRVKVGPNNFFVLGDNRHDALDSTYLGAIPFDSIIAKRIK
jgi:signal peptidase I